MSSAQYAIIIVGAAEILHTPAGFITPILVTAIRARFGIQAWAAKTFSRALPCTVSTDRTIKVCKYTGSCAHDYGGTARRVLVANILLGGPSHMN